MWSVEKLQAITVNRRTNSPLTMPVQSGLGWGWVDYVDRPGQNWPNFVHSQPGRHPRTEKDNDRRKRDSIFEFIMYCDKNNANNE